MLYTMICDFFTGVFGVLAILAFFFIPAILQVKWEDYRNGGPKLPPGTSDCDCYCHRSWDRPVW